MAANFDRKAKSGSSLRQDTSLIDRTETYNYPSQQPIRAGDGGEDTQSRINHHSSGTTVHPESKGFMARKAPKQAHTVLSSNSPQNRLGSAVGASSNRSIREKRESRHLRRTTHWRVTKRLPNSELLRAFQFLSKLREKSEWVLLLT